MSRVEVNGVQLEYTVSGQGPHVIQIPGALSGKEGDAAATPGLAEHYTVIDYDRRGYGGSDRPQQTDTLDVWVADSVALLDVSASSARTCAAGRWAAPSRCATPPCTPIGPRASF